MIDRQTIDHCIRRDERSMKVCYERCAPYVYTIIKSYINDPDSRKDVLQNTFIQIFASLATYDVTKGVLKSWIAKITIRQCIRHLQKNKQLSLFVQYDQGMLLDVQESESIPIDQLSDQEIQRLLQDMPVGYKTVFLMSVIDDNTHEEIASHLGISPKTSRSQLSRGIRWIKKNILKEAKNYIYGEQ